MLVRLKIGEHLGLLTIVDDAVLNVIVDKVVLGIAKHAVESGHLTLEILYHVVGLAITNLLILAREHRVENVERVVGYARVVG